MGSRLADSSGLGQRAPQGLDREVNATAIVTLDKTDIEYPAGVLPRYLLDDIGRGLRRVLDL